MNKKYGMWLIVSIGLMGTGFGCSSSEDDDLPESPDVVDVDAQHYAEVFGQLFDRNMEGTYILTDGICLDAAAPGVYTICADSVSAGEAFFYSRCVPAGEESHVTVSPAGVSYSFGDYGTATLLVSPDNADCSARILLNLTEKSEVEELQFVPRALWPDNEVRSPFNAGYVLREVDTKALWFCLRKREGSNMGILMSFDYGWEVGGMRGRDTLYTNCASELAWTCFCALKSENEDYFEQLSQEVHTWCNRKKNPCAKDAYIPFDLIRGKETERIRWVQVGNWDAKRKRVSATRLNQSIVGFNLLRYQSVVPGDSVFCHSASRTFDYSDNSKYVTYYPLF